MFSCLFWNIENTRCSFLEFVLCFYFPGIYPYGGHWWGKPCQLFYLESCQGFSVISHPYNPWRCQKRKIEEIIYLRNTLLVSLYCWLYCVLCTCTQACKRAVCWVRVLNTKLGANYVKHALPKIATPLVIKSHRWVTLWQQLIPLG